MTKLAAIAIRQGGIARVLVARRQFPGSTLEKQARAARGILFD